MSLHKKNYEIIAGELRRVIEEGVIKPGDKLDTIDQLAVLYRVGRSTVREALSHLKALGLIESRQGGGTYVRRKAPEPAEVLGSLQSSNAELNQVLQVRQIIEVGTAELAAKFRTEADILELARIIELMEHAVGNEEISQIYDTNFHLAIAKASQNPMLEAMMSHISVTILRTIQDSRKLWLYSERETARKLFEEHKNIYEAIRDRSPKTAATVMTKHLAQVDKALQSTQKMT